jgi:Uma2 family endonuclease
MVHAAVETLERQDKERRLPMSYEEFLTWSGENVHAEWIGGEVIIFMPPKKIHQEIVGFLHNLITLFVNLFDLGVVLTAPFEMHVSPDGPAREPDLLFVARNHLDRLTPERLAGPADLIVEVVSDESVHRDRVDKFYEYQGNGIREYWIIDPREGKQRADFYYLAPEGRYQAVLPDDDGKYHSSVLPGFWFRPDWLWADELPDPLLALAEVRGLSPEATASLRAMLAGES